MDRKQGYIEGSVRLPDTDTDTDTDCDTLSLVIPSLDRPTLFYCNGPKCGHSVKAIHKAQACGYNMGLTVVAEGVEDHAMLDSLRALGCDRAQGYHIARPLPMSAFMNWLDGRSEAAAGAAEQRHAGY